jgi:tetratricopeptide (TPR) repeat protein
MHQEPLTAEGSAAVASSALRHRWVLLASAHGFALLAGLVYFKTAKVIDVAMQVRLHWSVGPLAYAQELAVAVLWVAGLVLAGLAVRHRRWAGRIVFGVASLLEIAAFFYGMFNVHYFRLFGIPLNLEAMSDVEKVGDFWTTIVPYLTSWHTFVAGLLSVVVVALPLWLKIERIERWITKVGRGFARGWRSPVAGSVALATIVLVPIDEYELAHNDVVEMASSALRVWLEDERPAGEFVGKTNRPIISYSEPGVMVEPPPELRRLKKKIRQANGNEPMNVVFIVLESMVSPDVAEELGIDEAMPYLNKLRKRSVVLEDYSTVFPLSMKSLITLTCSLLPSPERMTLTKINPRLDCRSVSEVATEHGYRAGLFHSGYYSFTMKDLFFADRGYDVMLDAEDFAKKNPEWNRNAWGIQEEGAVSSMLEWIDEAPDEPFLAVYVPVVGHYPYVPLRAKFRDQYGTETQVDNYKNAVGYADAMVKRVVRSLRKRKLTNDTIFVIVGDHGLPLELHANNDVQSAAIYEENVRTFAYIYQPRHIKETIEYPEIVQHADILPSLYDLLGWDIPDRYAGVSIFSPYRKKMAVHYTLRSKKLAALRDGDLKVILDLRKGSATVYDLEADPREREDLAADYPEFVAYAEEFFAGFLPSHVAFIEDYPVIPTQTELPPGLVERIAGAPASPVERDAALTQAAEWMQADSDPAYQRAEALMLSLLKKDESDFEVLVTLVRIYDRLAVLHTPARYERSRRSLDAPQDTVFAQLAHTLRARVRVRFPDRKAELDRVTLWSALTGENSKAEDRAFRFLAARAVQRNDPDVIALGTQLIRDTRARKAAEQSAVMLEDVFDQLADYVAAHPEDWFIARKLFDLYWRELRDLSAATTICDASCAIESDNLTLVLDVAEAYYSYGLFDQAQPLLERAAVLASGTQMEIAVPLIRSRLGGIAFLIGDYETADREFKAVLEHDSKHAMALGGLGMIALRNGEIGAAEEYVDRALTRERRKTWAWNADGELRDAKGEKSRKSYAKGAQWKLLSADSHFFGAMKVESAPVASRNLASVLKEFGYDARRFENYAEMSQALKDLEPESRLPTDIDGLREYNAKYQADFVPWQRASKAEGRGLRRRAAQIALEYVKANPSGPKRGSMQSIIRRARDEQPALDDEDRPPADGEVHGPH